jgi:cell division protein FtsW (lipid II flippase)
MKDRKQTKPLGGRLRLWFWTLAALCAVVFWVVIFMSSDFAEPPQLAVVGHYSPWREQPGVPALISVGTDRRLNDISLYDRKASPVHFVLKRRGNSDRWWAELYNQSDNRDIEIRRAAKPDQVLRINRHLLQNGDRFVVPRFDSSAPTDGQDGKLRDPCSPSAVKAWLTPLHHPTDSETSDRDLSSPLNIHSSGTATPTKLAPSLPMPKNHRQTSAALHPVDMQHFVIERRNISLSPFHTNARLRWRDGSLTHSIWLDQTRRYKLPQQSGGGWLEYRHNRWQIQLEGRWTPLLKALSWGDPPTQIEIVRHPRFSIRPSYSMGLLHSPCRWEITPQSMPAGLELGRIARLDFQQSRLVVQHLGREQLSLQISPQNQAPKQLGVAQIYSGDFIAVGQLTYRVIIGEKYVRLMLERLPQNYLWPLTFFRKYPSEQIAMRRTLTSRHTLILTGGEGSNIDSQHWQIPLPLAGEPGQTQLPSPYGTFLSVTPITNRRYQLTPTAGIPLYMAKPDGTFTKPAISKPTSVSLGNDLYYAQRFYLRIFQPSYRALAWYIALFWLFIAGGVVLCLHWLLHTGRLQIALAMPSANASNWLQWPILALWPLALFLNGLGLYVLAILSLSSLGLNNHSFLYRQLLWSLVGVVLFLIILSFSKSGFLDFLNWICPQKISALRQRLFPERPTRIQYTSITRPRISRTSLVIASACYTACCIAISLLFQSAAILLVAMFAYIYMAIITSQYRRNRNDQLRRRGTRLFFLTLLLLGLVPLLSVLPFPIVHNNFFLRRPVLGTVKLSEFAILSAIAFFAYYLGLEVFGILRVKAAIQKNKSDIYSVSAEHLGTSAPSEQTTSASNRSKPLSKTDFREVRTSRQIWERLGSAILVSMLYLLLLGAIGIFYTIQGDLGPGLILTFCFSLYMLFAFLTTGADRLTTIGNILRIATVFGGFLLFFWLPDILAWLFPEWIAHNSQFQKVRERLSIWHQPWRFIIGEQILHNLWNLASYKGAFQWFSNLHSDFALTAVVRALSAFWGYVTIAISSIIPLLTLAAARCYWPSFTDTSPSSPEIAKLQTQTIKAMIMLFGGIYLFAQNLIHIGSVLRITPMTGVTFTWVSSGGTSLIVCYIVIAIIYRQMRCQNE